MLRNAPKQLTTAQIKQMVDTYSDIKQLLDTGHMTKEEIAKAVDVGVATVYRVLKHDKVSLHKN